MSAFQVIQQRPVMVEQRLGSIPKSAYVQNNGSSPNVAPAAEQVPGDIFEVSNGVDVKAMVPQRNEDGTLKLTSENVTLTEDKHDPKRFALVGGLAAGAAGAVAGGATGGLFGAIAGGLLSAAGGAGVGYRTAELDSVSVVTREATVTEPVLKGYESSSAESSYEPKSPATWFADSGGSFHYNVPVLEQRPVGTVQVHEVLHSKPGQYEVGGLSAGLGAVVGLLAGTAARAIL